MPDGVMSSQVIEDQLLLFPILRFQRLLHILALANAMLLVREANRLKDLPGILTVSNLRLDLSAAWTDSRQSRQGRKGGMRL